MGSKQLKSLRAPVVALLVLLAVLSYFLKPGGPPSPLPGDEYDITGPAIDPGPGNYLFCFWNVENLFDDKNDNLKTRGDKEFDGYFSSDTSALAQKLKNLTNVLVKLNDGKGPDILCLAEVESEWAAQLLQRSLYRRLGNSKLAYRNRLFKRQAGGRHIATAILTRLPVEADRTQLLGSRRRILEGHVKAAGQPLVVIASHWTSRVTDESKEGVSRQRYANAIYGQFKRMYTTNPKVDLLVCGDFNDNPDDESVRVNLHATGDAAAVRNSDEPMMFNPFALLYKQGEASHYYGRKAYMFDQVCLSPGLLNQEGWSYVDGSAKVIKQMDDGRGRPLRFGGKSDKRPLEARGASDHFPVTVRLQVR